MADNRRRSTVEEWRAAVKVGQWTDTYLASSLDSLASSLRQFTPSDRIAMLHEAATRLRRPETGTEWLDDADRSGP